MICPRCGNAMKPVERDGIRSHDCAACGGTWVSGGSLHELFAREVDTPHIEEALETILAMDFRDGRRHCPSCRGRRLVTLDVENIELDYCVRCKGLFFDPGEIDRVFPHAYRDRPGSGGPIEARGFFQVIVARFSRDRR